MIEYKKALTTTALVTLAILITSVGLICVVGGQPGTWKSLSGNNRWTCINIKCTSSGRYDSTGNRFDWADHWGSGWTDLSYFPFVGRITRLSLLCEAEGNGAYSFTMDILRSPSEGNGGYAAPGSFTSVHTKVDMSGWLIAPPLVAPYIIIYSGGASCQARVSP